MHAWVVREGRETSMPQLRLSIDRSNQTGNEDTPLQNAPRDHILDGLHDLQTARAFHLKSEILLLDYMM